MNTGCAASARWRRIRAGARRDQVPYRRQGLRRVKVHIFVDWETIIIGPGTPTDLSRDREDQLALLTSECQGAIQGCFDAGAMQVVVSHRPDEDMDAS